MAGDAVEALGLRAQGRLALRRDVVDDGGRRCQGLCARSRRPRNGGEEFGGRERAAAKIDRAEHPFTISRLGTLRAAISRG